MTNLERETLKSVKLDYKKSKKKNFVLYKEQRDDLIRQMLACTTPNWGNINLSISK